MLVCGLVQAQQLAGPVAAPSATKAVEAPALVAQLALAKKGSADAQFLVAGMYERGQGAPQSYVEAAKWYRLAAEQGHAGAQFFLGAMYGSDRGVPRDFVEAVNWYQKSAAQGYRDALYPVAYAYENGITVQQDFVESHKWYLRSAEAGVWQAMDRLARAYTAGELGLKPDAEQASIWRAKATAAQGDQRIINAPARQRSANQNEANK
ncbi:tetratricopeptide repeat protein [Paucibacter soli]|uniref:tetratricopeptide repeat protein n=1 Tax=Paucibacter soli TaxID=3133433 RepID=UPI0030A6FCA3